jgi:hypothetical protein
MTPHTHSCPDCGHEWACTGDEQKCDESCPSPSCQPMPWCEPCQCYHMPTAEHVADVRKRLDSDERRRRAVALLERLTPERLAELVAWLDSRHPVIEPEGRPE